jgi:AcrR family transcriptional regulator
MVGRKAVASLADQHPYLPPQQQRSRDALTRILTGGEDLLRTAGADGFSMAAVAAAAGLPVGNIYRRFRGKFELIQAIREQVAERDLATVTERLKGVSDELRPFVGAYIGIMLDLFCGDDPIYAVFMDPRLQGVTHEACETGEEQIFALYKSGLSRRLPKAAMGDEDTIARVSYAIIVSAVQAKLISRDALIGALPMPALKAAFTDATLGYIDGQIPQRPTP